MIASMEEPIKHLYSLIIIRKNLNDEVNYLGTKGIPLIIVREKCWTYREIRQSH